MSLHQVSENSSSPRAFAKTQNKQGGWRRGRGRGRAGKYGQGEEGERRKTRKMSEFGHNATLVVLKQAHHPGKSPSRGLPLGLDLSCLFSRAIAFSSAACCFISPPSLSGSSRSALLHQICSCRLRLKRRWYAPATCITLLPHTVHSPYRDTLRILA